MNTNTEPKQYQWLRSQRVPGDGSVSDTTPYVSLAHAGTTVNERGSSADQSTSSHLGVGHSTLAPGVRALADAGTSSEENAAIPEGTPDSEVTSEVGKTDSGGEQTGGSEMNEESTKLAPRGYWHINLDEPIPSAEWVAHRD